ncbi:hypothetical protein C8R45DRAFT_1076756 [Mycena sanguinolenta]|nr:hypothetical protein C8R45DRAFT_1076756 [Mycena sanguinolenta]
MTRSLDFGKNKRILVKSSNTFGINFLPQTQGSVRGPLEQFASTRFFWSKSGMNGSYARPGWRFSPPPQASDAKLQTACMLIFVRLHGFRLRMVPRSDTTVIWGTDVATLREDYVRDEFDHKPLGNPTLSDTCVATMKFIKVHTAAAPGTADWYSLVNESGSHGNGSQLACTVNLARS